MESTVGPVNLARGVPSDRVHQPGNPQRSYQKIDSHPFQGLSSRISLTTAMMRLTRFPSPVSCECFSALQQIVDNHVMLLT